MPFRELTIKKSDKPQVAMLKTLIQNKNLSVPIASRITGYSTTTLYRWIDTNQFYPRKIAEAIRKLKQAKSL